MSAPVGCSFISRQIARRLPAGERAEYLRRAEPLADLPIRSQRDMAALLPALPGAQMLTAMHMARAPRWRVVGAAIVDRFATGDADTNLPTGVRRQAAEGIASLRLTDRRSAEHRRTWPVLVEMLSDPSP